eukprot:m.375089 g.375089  ORF g.375089 m.375089 type:complete len:62 (-) comp75746_c0_seq1:38-223(-)
MNVDACAYGHGEKGWKAVDKEERGVSNIASVKHQLQTLSNHTNVCTPQNTQTHTCMLHRFA